MKKLIILFAVLLTAFCAGASASSVVTAGYTAAYNVQMKPLPRSAKAAFTAKAAAST